MWYLDTLRERLSDDDSRQLQRIFSPKVVAVQPEDSRRGICVMPDGEIRCYGIADKPSVFGEGKVVYLSSYDCGLSWKLKYAAGNSVMGAAYRIPDSGRYVTIVSDKTGTWALLSDLGPDDPEPKRIKMSDDRYSDMFQPFALEKRSRLVCTMHLIRGGNYIPSVAYSDDSGESWSIVNLNSTPKFEVQWPHLGLRWENNGAEPILTEMPDGRLMLLARTSLDYLYVYYSSDGGESWTDGEPSEFHCTLTTPFFLKMSNGKYVFFWNNTRPLPEVDQTKAVPALNESTINGFGEDVFTNRDANHAAISDDCINWSGFRELYLNDIRNEPDFRSHGGIVSSADKSVHQFQAIELPFNKILVAFGQHEASRRMVIFDADWLTEKYRSEDFANGLVNMSTQMYVKSISGCHLGSGAPGHCAWNRTNGALLVPSPEGGYREALQICRIHDERLFSELQGVVWNFPALRQGKIKLDIRIGTSGIRVCLCDHWMNPCDKTVPMYSQFSFELTGEMLGANERRTVEIVFDTYSDITRVLLGERELFKVEMCLPAPFGISYLHIQTLAQMHDPVGSYIYTITAGGE